MHFDSMRITFVWNSISVQVDFTVIKAEKQVSRHLMLPTILGIFTITLQVTEVPKMYP